MPLGYDTAIGEDPAQPGVLVGPWRKPRNMLGDPAYDDHASIHDDATARKLGFRGGTVEGPTHFSQLAPLGALLWGRRWFETGCVSAHYRSPLYDGEEARAFLRTPEAGGLVAEMWMTKPDGEEILRGTLSVEGGHDRSALQARLATLAPLEDALILRGARVGDRAPRRRVRMDAETPMGPLYPFSLADKLTHITEPSAWHLRDAEGSPWGRPILPLEMISVLSQYAADQDGFSVRGPVVGLFADQEIRLHDGPLFAGEDYDLEREVVALSGSRRTESLWIRSRIFAAGGEAPLATLLLNQAFLKESYAGYAKAASA